LIKTAASRVPAACCIAAFAAGIAIVLALSPVETATRKIEAYEHGLYKKKTAIIALCHAGIMAASAAFGARRCAFVVMYAYIVQSVMLLCRKACRIKN
ncbi:MAG: accessory gene regulator B family protein, partial [Clostridia bacterium]|nr:accessory gene regulator B family protein [Clostridia bacterium]